MRDKPVKDTDLPSELITSFQRGIMAYHYKGVPTLKCPMDMALYMDILWKVKPGTILEIGSYSGGSAVWFADILGNYGLNDTKVISLDVKPVTDIDDPRIEYGFCDAGKPDEVLTEAFFSKLVHPIVLIEDSSHLYEHTLNILRCCDQWLLAGDYVIVEDGIIHHQQGCPRYNGGPLRAVEEFLAERGDYYEIDRERCDYYGKNVTWNTDGFLRRIK